jgi:hypothetical protein
MKETEMTNDEQGPMENVLDGLDQQSDALTSEELKAELQARGINIDPFLQEIDDMIAVHDKGERLAWMQVEDEKKESLRVAETPEFRYADRKPEEILAGFALFLKAGGPNRALAFKNRGNLSVEDMAAILDADKRLQHLEQSHDATQQ